MMRVSKARIRVAQAGCGDCGRPNASVRRHWPDLIADPGVQAIVVTTPAAAHFALAQAALPVGKHLRG